MTSLVGALVDDRLFLGHRWQSLHGREPAKGFLTAKSRILFWPLQPRLDEVYIEDIACGLANECRFGNQLVDFYSVAEHSVLLSYMVPRPLARWALIHDTPEAYMSDIPRPIKTLPEFEEYRRREIILMRLLSQFFNMEQEEEPPELKPYDQRIAYLENIVFKGDAAIAKIRASNIAEEEVEYALEHRSIIEKWGPAKAYDAWIARYEELF